jgi:hypothetical protein
MMKPLVRYGLHEWHLCLFFYRRLPDQLPYPPKAPCVIFQLGQVPAVTAQRPAVLRCGMRRLATGSNAETASRPHWHQGPTASKPLACPVVGYGGYAVSHNCPGSRWEPSRLAGVGAGSHGIVVSGRW